jgi:hypothetical protein
MDETEMRQLQARCEEREGMSLEERQVVALEEISDALIGLVRRLDRIAEKI